MKIQDKDKEIILKLICYMLINDFSLKDIGEILDVTGTTISNWIKKKKISRHNYFDLAFLLKDYNPPIKVYNFIKENINIFYPEYYL